MWLLYRKGISTHDGGLRESNTGNGRNGRMTIFDFPDWLPPRMRYTADPVQRLQSLLSDMQSLAGAEHRLTRGVRVWKIHHLCHQIDPDACAAPVACRLNDAQVDEVFKAAASALKSLPAGERPPAVLISAVHISAACSQSARRSIHRARAVAGADR